MSSRYLYFVLNNGKVIAPFENEIDDLINNSSDEWYVTKGNRLCHKFSYADEIDFDDNLGRANYSHYSTEYEYLGKVVAKFRTIEELVNYLLKSK